MEEVQNLFGHAPRTINVKPIPQASSLAPSFHSPKTPADLQVNSVHRRTMELQSTLRTQGFETCSTRAVREQRSKYHCLHISMAMFFAAISLLLDALPRS
jgi:hypothetical protein